jgi:hypothetical protein
VRSKPLPEALIYRLFFSAPLSISHLPMYPITLTDEHHLRTEETPKKIGMSVEVPLIHEYTTNNDLVGKNETGNLNELQKAHTFCFPFRP